MLITNFASGELSETLFGRIDLPQYFSGAARIVNFDVIPTGGLRRRSGFERIRKLDNEGRLIPFTVNRDMNFLLFLAPDAITAYRLEGGAVTGGSVFNKSASLPLYSILAEIEDVQCAQNYDTMILVHENYPPLEIKFKDSNLQINILKMSFLKTVVQGKDVTAGDAVPYQKDDDVYANGRLTKAGHYPCAVSFFNGRLVFAATKNEKQRLFFSAVKKENESYNFATNKVFLTEKKEYVMVRGKISAGSNLITVKDYETPMSFYKKLSGYFAESTFFNPGTFIVSIMDNVINVSSGANISLNVNDEEFTELNNWRSLYNWERTEELNAERLIGNFYNVLFSERIYMRCMVNEALFYKACWPLYEINSEPVLSIRITNGMAQEVIDSSVIQARQYLKSIFDSQIENHFSFMSFSDNDYNAALDVLINQIKTYWQYNFRGETITGHPDEIYQKIMLLKEGTEVYIPFYTREIISDEYPTPDCGFTFEIASDMNDAIRWLVMNKGLIAGTETGEWIIPPEVHATDARAVLNSRFGSDRIQGAAVGDAVCFFQAGKKSLAEYYIPQQDNNFRANNMAFLSSRMLSESPAKEFDYLSSPYAKLLITREDGSMVTLLYERNTGTFAWGRIVTAGEIKSCAVLPGADGNDDAYLVVKRDALFYLERLKEDCEVYLDSFREDNGTMTGLNYESSVRSMPILANDRMKQNVIKNLLVRFHDSFMPRLKALPNGKVDTIPKEEPYTGVFKLPFPGVWDHDVSFEFIHDKPSRCKLLAINAEVN
jgi:hypothetical protein